MLYLFSTKMALRKAMVGLSNGHLPTKTIESIANYLTDGRFSKIEDLVKAGEDVVASLERQSNTHAEVIRAQEEEIGRLDAEISKGFDVIESLREQILEEQEALDLMREYAKEDRTSAYGAEVHQRIIEEITGTPESQLSS